MANTVNKAVVYNRFLDEAVQAGLTSAPLTAAPSRVQYLGGGDVKIAKLSVGGLGTYARDTGYPAGSATLEWETFSMRNDRGIKFLVDVMDEDETGGTLSAANIINEFASNEEAPEIDSVRYSSIFQGILSASTARYGWYTPAITDIFTQFNNDIADIRKVAGRNITLMAFMNESAFATLANSSEVGHTFNVQSGGSAVNTDK